MPPGLRSPRWLGITFCHCRKSESPPSPGGAWHSACCRRTWTSRPPGRIQRARLRSSQGGSDAEADERVSWVRSDAARGESDNGRHGDLGQERAPTRPWLDAFAPYGIAHVGDMWARARVSSIFIGHPGGGVREVGRLPGRRDCLHLQPVPERNMRLYRSEFQVSERWPLLQRRRGLQLDTGMCPYGVSLYPILHMRRVGGPMLPV